VVQITAALTKRDDDQHFRERAQNGELVLNYGVSWCTVVRTNEVFKLSTSAQQTRP